MSDGTTEERVYGNRYAIQSKIARGGMADVFLAQDRLLDRPVALKVLFPELSTDPNFVERFRREAQNAARLSHPNVVSVYDWGEENNVYYIVMEFVDGKPLSAMLRENGPLDVQRAAFIGAETAAALAFAHHNGVIHRDVKPGNILIDRNGAVKVTDFGIARARNATESLTQTGAVMGTATYFSPEQAQGLSVDERSDVYSAGIVLYEMVAGKAPFTGENPVAIAYKHVREQATPLHDIDGRIPEDYEAIVNQAMAKNAANRYPTADDLRADLVRFSRGQAVEATAIAPSINATQAIPRTQAQVRQTYQQPQPAPQTNRVAEKEGKGVAGPLIGLLLLLVLLGVVGYFIFNGGIGRDDDAEQVAMPTVTQKAEADARAELEALGLTVSVERENNETAEGTVVGQDPAGGAQVQDGDRVTITVSEGPAPITLANYTGQNGDTVANQLRGQGITVNITQANSDSIESGNIISQNPSSGRQVSSGDTVTLTVSSGAQQVEVPQVLNATQATAEQLIRDAGLVPQVTTDFSETVREGTVISVNPSVGTQVNDGSAVQVVVSDGPDPDATTTTTAGNPGSTTTTSTTRPNNGNGNGNNNGN